MKLVTARKASVTFIRFAYYNEPKGSFHMRLVLGLLVLWSANSVSLAFGQDGNTPTCAGIPANECREVDDSIQIKVGECDMRSPLMKGRILFFESGLPKAFQGQTYWVIDNGLNNRYSACIRGVARQFKVPAHRVNCGTLSGAPSRWNCFEQAEVNLEFYETGVLKSGDLGHFVTSLIFEDGLVHAAYNDVQFDADGYAKCPISTECWWEN